MKKSILVLGVVFGLGLVAQSGFAETQRSGLGQGGYSSGLKLGQSIGGLSKWSEHCSAAMKWMVVATQSQVDGIRAAHGEFARGFDVGFAIGEKSGNVPASCEPAKKQQTVKKPKRYESARWQ